MAFRKPIHMTAEDHGLVTDAVRAAEEQCDGEVITIVTDVSDHYADTPHKWAAIGAFLMTSALLVFPAFFNGIINGFTGGWNQHVEPEDYVFIVLLVAVVSYGLFWALLIPRKIRLFFTTKSAKERRVRDKAIAAFRIGGEGRTHGATAVLIYVSLSEHRAEIVADRAIVEKVAPEEWGDAMAVLIGRIKRGEAGLGMAEAVTAVGALIALHFPKTEADTNELPDRLIEL
jgi:putative membrane protein